MVFGCQEKFGSLYLYPYPDSENVEFKKIVVK
jgi:hypothetical protein